ncbi:RagB/SusD family nutrient uptake outer membrane protein [Flammeovirga sp. OC4]|uniref:RagB/SusD family nutrient uptake outer membrane protein n=1 Tax=Flammeovirga sp. OC4 TaxID=1382345 RepID=UPI0005C6A875|nr:RagB/SusD family nutrient uptake outer membrane protein [Flammeovirga sp. OC4]
MKIKNLLYKGVLVAAVMLSSCVNDLDTVPIDPDSATRDRVYQSVSDYQLGLAKLYGGLSLSGQRGPSGDADLQGLDEGASQYIRKYWELQELPTDEALNGWGDPGQPQMSQNTWTADNPIVKIMYDRVFYQIALCNQFIRDVATYEGEDKADLEGMIAEARLLRALSYWHALDFFGNGIPMIDENSPVGSTPPTAPEGGFQGTEIFDYIESELLELVALDNAIFKDAGRGLIGQVDKGAAYMMLTKLYINAKIYRNTEAGYDEYLTKANQALDAINGIYSLEQSYANNFLSDNYLSREIIFAVSFDGLSTQTWGGTTFLVHGAVGGDMISTEYGVDSGWGGHRSTSSLISYFKNTAGVMADPRGATTTGSAVPTDMFFSGHNLKDEDDNVIGKKDETNPKLSDFTDGFAVVKFKNINRFGSPGKDPNLTFVDTNFPFFRYADAILMRAEIGYRQSGSIDMSLIEQIWDRAGVSTALRAEYTAKATSDPEGFLLDERARELYWEGHRRQDLIRFGKYSQGLNWPWKGGTYNENTDGYGKEVIEEKYRYYPIPNAELGANPNLTQNPLY